MKYHQRDIVELEFPLPGGESKLHPAIIVSNDELQEIEGYVYLVMISSQDFSFNRQYTYPLSDEMLSFKMEKPSFAKCQLIASDVETGIIRKLGTIKVKYFNEIVDKVIESIF